MSAYQGHNWRDPREHRYSASSYDHAFDLLHRDPKGIVKQIIRTNALPQWQKPEMIDEAKQDLALYLHSRYASKPDELVQMMNDGHLNYFLVSYFSRQLRSRTSQHAKRWRHHDDLTDEHDEPHHDEPFEFGGQVRNVKLTDPDVIRWRLGHALFSAFTSDQKTIYLQYLDESLAIGKKVKVTEFAERHKLPYRSTVDLVTAINRMMIDRVNQIEDQDE